MPYDVIQTCGCLRRAVRQQPVGRPEALRHQTHDLNGEIRRLLHQKLETLFVDRDKLQPFGRSRWPNAAPAKPALSRRHAAMGQCLDPTDPRRRLAVPVSRTYIRLPAFPRKSSAPGPGIAILPRWVGTRFDDRGAESWLMVRTTSPIVRSVTTDQPV